MRNAYWYLKVGGVSAVIIRIGVYAFFASKDLIKGPTLTIVLPINGSATSTSLVTIRGLASNVAFLTLNDRQIFTDENGRIEEQLLLSYGYNIITLKGKDKFGKETTKRLELIY